MDMNALLNSYGTTFSMMTPYLKIVGIMFAVMFFLLTFNYQLQALKSMFAKMQGKRKLAIVYNDKQISYKWASFKEDYIIISGKIKDKLYVLSGRGKYTDPFGEQVTFYHQDTTEDIVFVPRKKFIWVDKTTSEPLLDGKGNYVNDLNFLQIASLKYKKVIDEEVVKVDTLLAKKLLDEEAGVVLKLPLLIGDERNGFDSALTADVINRNLKIAMLDFLKKNWGTIMIVGVVILIGVLGSLIFTVQSNQKADSILGVVNYLASNINATTMKVVA